MPLEPILDLMRHARQDGYGIGYFESWNLESIQGVIDAAEETRSPVIIGFNGEFLCRSDRQSKERLSWYAALGKAAAESASVPCGLIFNECAQDNCTRQAVRLGFNMISISDPKADHDNYVCRVVDLTKYAHEHRVTVESEIDKLPSGASGKVEDGGSLTDPELAARFVGATSIDLLAVSVGNVHVMVQGEQGLDLKRLTEIRKRVSIPLVLHGGTGISADALRMAISMGVVKVNYGTYLKQRYLAAVRTALNNDPTNPHQLLGYGGREDVMVAGRLAVRDAVLERMEILGCCGRA